MDKPTLHRILASRYELVDWQRVLRDVFGATTVLQRPDESLTARLSPKDKELASRAAELGSFETADGRAVGIYQVDLTDKPRIWQNRIGLRQLLRSVYKHDVDAALVVFVAPDKQKWRLSLISEIRVLENGDWVERKTETKRYTYLLGEGETVRTAVDRLELLQYGAHSLDSLIDAFSVDKLNKDFFADYDAVFKRVEEEVKESIPDLKPNDKEAKERRRLFTQRLFNRLMFIYFLQKKGWLSFNGDTNYLQRLLREAVEHAENFFADRLYWLFFSGLGEADNGDLHNSSLLRSIRGEVPYLNGGLFEKDDDGFDNRQAVSLNNGVFRNGEKQGILDLFERYNFTIDESSPLDVQVAVDPEMLGKVFEELVTRRGDTGSYYTPRTIVQFMCREALTRFLSATGVAESKIRNLVYDYSVDDLTIAEARSLLSKLAGIRIVDPACGSGAYLLGILQELTTLTGLLDTRANNDQKELFDRKLEIIKTNLYGVDIDKFAVQIARLRLWLSLAVDFTGDEPQPLPNLDFKIECGDSLTAPDPSRANLDGVASEIEQYRTTKARFFDASIRVPHDKEYRDGLLAKARELHDQIAFWVHSNASARATENAFDWAIEFAEVFRPDAAGNRGFDVVLANPPYGAKVADNVRDLYFDRRAEGPQSKDTYGLFMARGIQLLRRGGTLSYIVSDTWRTIKSHLPLRRRILTECTIHHFLDLPPWVFDATVNTCILTLSKLVPGPENMVIAGDLRNIPTRNWKMLEDNLLVVSVHGFDAQTLEYARYSYTQDLISTYDNLSFFIASPELYGLMGDARFTKLSVIAEVKQGLATADNQYYLRKRAGVRGSYEILDESKLLSDEQIANLTEDEKRNGVDPSEYGGRHFVPYDKGGESDASGGWLPNYYVPTGYFMDWSKAAVNRLRTATIADVKRRKGEQDKIRQSDETTKAAVIRSPQHYFAEGITFSRTGVYAPTYRLGSSSVFDTEGSAIFSHGLSPRILLGLLSSLFLRYQIKVFIDHTVHAQVDDLKEVMIPKNLDRQENELRSVVEQIVKKQKVNLQYPYHLNEQKEIDKLVHQLYGLTPEQIREVEIWYCRRYPLLAEAQGFTSETRKKYADHFARCERILSKPPEYWQSKPVLALVAAGESAQLEFKETLEANNRTGEPLPGLMLSVLKTIAAFLNTNGGTLLIGVSDSGEIKGLKLDLNLCGQPTLDRFELKLHDLIKARLKAPVGSYTIQFEHLSEGDVCRIDVEARPGVIFVDDKDVYVRVGNRTEKLEGPRLAEWIPSRSV